MPDDLRSAEAAVREAIAAQLARGKVECRSRSRASGESEPRLNPAALEQLAALDVAGSHEPAGGPPLTTADVLGWPGVVETPGAEPDALRAQVSAALAEALDALAESRRREGEALRRRPAGSLRANRARSRRS